jgi:hypothetical protein
MEIVVIEDLNGGVPTRVEGVTRTIPGLLYTFIALKPIDSLDQQPLMVFTHMNVL